MLVMVKIGENDKCTTSLNEDGTIKFKSNGSFNVSFAEIEDMMKIYNVAKYNTRILRKRLTH